MKTEKIEVFKESEIRQKILTKVDPGKINKKSKHWKGYILIGKTVVAKVKIPNNHDRRMYQEKSKRIARDLKLDYGDFNRLIRCPMKKTEYYQKLKNSDSSIYLVRIILFSLLDQVPPIPGTGDVKVAPYLITK